MHRRIVASIIGIVALALATGCSSSASSGSASTRTTVASAVSTLPSGADAQAQTPNKAPNETAEVGTGGELIDIQSDNVRAAGYDDATGTMTVLFDSGGLYEYYDVPARLWLEFVAAQPHPWSAVGDPQLVKGGVAYTRIG